MVAGPNLSWWAHVAPVLLAILPHYRQIMHTPSDVAVISDPAVGLAVGISGKNSVENSVEREGGVGLGLPREAC